VTRNTYLLEMITCRWQGTVYLFLSNTDSKIDRWIEPAVDHVKYVRFGARGTEHSVPLLLL
jgi:hypothetical protein